jgi:hypothetical protein
MVGLGRNTVRPGVLARGPHWAAAAGAEPPPRAVALGALVGPRHGAGLARSSWAMARTKRSWAGRCERARWAAGDGAGAELGEAAGWELGRDARAHEGGGERWAERGRERGRGGWGGPPNGPGKEGS